MTVGDDVQLTVDFQAAARMVEHLPRNVIGQRVFLVERRVAQHRVKAERLHAGERVVDHKLAAIQRLWQVSFHVQTAGGHRHWRFVAKHHAGVRVFRQQRQANHTVPAAQVDDLPFQIFRQMFHKEACADIQAGTGEDVCMVVDGPVGAFQLPAQRLWRVGQLRCAKRTVDQTRFFPGKRSGGWTEDFLEQLQRRRVDIACLGTRDNTGFWRDDFSQRAQLLLQQRHGFWHFDQHYTRRLRVLRGAVEELHAGFVDFVMAQVFTRRQLA